MPEQKPGYILPELMPENQDLYCLTCGYNLRGLTGDPRRCPECGNLNPIGEITLPGEIISRQLRRMETAPAICVAAVLIGGLWLLVVVSLLYHSRGFSSREVPWCLALFGQAVAVAWFVALLTFRASCMAKRGWIAALGRYHCYSLLAIGSVLLIYAGGLWLTIRLTATDFESLPRAGALYLLAIVMVNGVGLSMAVLAGRWAYRRAKGDMETLQREVAVSLARQRLGVALSAPQRGLFWKFFRRLP